MQENFILEFNKNPEEGFNYLQTILEKDKDEDWYLEIIAHSLLITRGISKSTLGKYFASSRDKN